MPASWLFDPAPESDRTPAAAHWRRELVAGAIGALVLFSIAVPVGALALAPLGSGFTGLAVAAGLASGVVATLVATLTSSDPAVRTGPMTAVALVLGSVLTSLLAIPALRQVDANGIPLAVVAGFACMAAGGVVQLLLGATRVGSVVSFTPRPVLAGFRNGVALLIVLAQIPVLLGLAAAGALEWRMHAGGWQPWTLLVGGAGVVAIVAARGLGAPSIAPLAGIVVATGTYYGLRFAGIQALGPVIGSLPSVADLAGVWHWSLPANAGTVTWPVLPLVSGALSMALVGCVLTLMAAKAMEESPLTRSDANHLLRGQGVANIAGALVGGVPIAGSLVQSHAMQRAGGRGRMASVVASVLLAVGVLAAHDAIAGIPLVALASVMLVIGWDTFDRDTLMLLRDLARPGAHRLSRAQDLLVIVVVAAASLLVDVVVGVVTGIIVAAVQFAVASSADVVRRHSSGAFRRSLHKRSEFESRRLDHAGAQTAVFELQGALFFGTAESLADDVMRNAATARYAIFDLARVHTVDATGAHLLAALRRHLRAHGGELLLSGCRERTPVRAALSVPGDDDPFAWFPDTDRALEWTESRLLAELTVDTTYNAELAFAQMDICHRLSPELVAQFQACAVRTECAAGTKLFAQGARGNEIFLIAHGRVSLMLERESGITSRRLATFGPGAVFGEMAVLESRVRTSSARCDTQVTVWRITRTALDAMARDNPVLGAAVYKALARVLAGRLRETTRELRDFTDP